ncbi:Zn(2)-C6 fungal-type domain-containing protein [Mycena chlorophos]|uniref:Zn(2)-C6 fungal-type domain-containing protein n=1 Tax=Mycena chlorophos TaxID=658473 RepID=A0A8H6S105_MYCCL|nr:Zn(2)-C6 fungal-type domain-containing protein [Mycena chlorophos]
MSSSSEKPARKRPACDQCKKRRVLCFPSTNGGPCPRCVEKNVMCTTTPVPRGRPRKVVIPQAAGASSRKSVETRAAIPKHPGPVFRTSLKCPELTPELIAHCFDASFHPLIIGDGPRPNSFTDAEFFATACSQDLLQCGSRRQRTFCALREEALKAAWEVGIMLQASTENAVSCFLLDLLEQMDFSGPSRPWASAYLSHVRTMAPCWHAAGFTTNDATQWAGFLMTEAIISASNRIPLLVTPHDQKMLAGPEVPALEAYLASLERLGRNTGANLSVLWTSIRTYLYHTTILSRQLSETIAGDYPRLQPLAEAAVLKFLTSLTLLQSSLTLLIDRVEALLDTTAPYGMADRSMVLPVEGSADTNIRIAAYGLVFAFVGLALSFHHELEYRATADTTAAHVVHPGVTGSVRERMGLLRGQARVLCIEGIKDLGRALVRLPRVHYGPTPVQWRIISMSTDFCLREAETASLGSLGLLEAMEALSDELRLLGYSLNGLVTPSLPALIERLEVHMQPRTSSNSSSSSPMLDRDRRASMTPNTLAHSAVSTAHDAFQIPPGYHPAMVPSPDPSSALAANLGLGLLLDFGAVDSNTLGDFNIDLGASGHGAGGGDLESGSGLGGFHPQHRHDRESLFGHMSGMSEVSMGMDMSTGIQIQTQWMMETAC